jgi:hypothetical protein
VFPSKIRVPILRLDDFVLYFLDAIVFFFEPDLGRSFGFLALEQFQTFDVIDLALFEFPRLLDRYPAC